MLPAASALVNDLLFVEFIDGTYIPPRTEWLIVCQDATALPQLGLGDRTEREFLNGGHTINGEGTFRFLRKHLRLG